MLGCGRRSLQRGTIDEESARPRGYFAERLAGRRTVRALAFGLDFGLDFGLALGFGVGLDGILGDAP